jgi:U3 small nucleolar RNA-associated protein 10
MKRVICRSAPSDDTLPELSLLAEILGSKPLPGSLDLVSALLETLSRLIQSSPPSQADVNYVQQMLMSAIDNAASNIPVCIFMVLCRRQLTKISRNRRI